MKIKWGAFVVDGRGKIGGHVASKNRSGPYLRTKVVPVNVDSVDQKTVRNNFTANSQGWKGITAAQRLAWNRAVGDFQRTDVLGDLRIMSGFNLYCALNGNLRFIGSVPITDPPTPAAVTAFTALSVAQATGAQTTILTYAPAIGANDTCIVQGTAAMSAGKTFVKSELRKYDFMLAADVTPFDNSAEYLLKFGLVGALGTKAFFTMQNVVTLTGLPGAKISASCIVGA